MVVCILKGIIEENILRWKKMNKDWIFNYIYAIQIAGDWLILLQLLTPLVTLIIRRYYLLSSTYIVHYSECSRKIKLLFWAFAVLSYTNKYVPYYVTWSTKRGLWWLFLWLMLFVWSKFTLLSKSAKKIMRPSPDHICNSINTGITPTIGNMEMKRWQH